MSPYPAPSIPATVSGAINALIQPPTIPLGRATDSSMAAKAPPEIPELTRIPLNRRSLPRDRHRLRWLLGLLRIRPSTLSSPHRPPGSLRRLITVTVGFLMLPLARE
jgi:hypothetical protein